MPKTLSIDEMGCEGCEDIVENALAGVAAVSDVDADHESGTVTVDGDATDDDLLRSVELAGYDAELADA
ncbi:MULTISPECIES: heavy-metal-associated domain-containing protein [Halobacterium]|uniref:HMA domain protein n=4 Tax=Halobacterium salinarum TaxID=2242 RepID=Q9HRH1_HALSA|nr:MULTISPECIES: heavy-metal-associated domain-containing protein [Halobacterium]AAG19187.1 hypothetical protein VNG_0702H [Halobacterium salinarum NRC-1]MBB6090030.1 copper chaperone CopZ [Halobacterium salinarum]MCF2165754.1 heavy-metal-associated domain-containing protein [Halobacterium salinarum]MCF2168282.1 heavy-metal-associated domain-containing protein [Halobacterium salinarum]MCF2208280.1 heavy-metal-associated domain-containing protein [Halobacterium salinarum]